MILFIILIDICITDIYHFAISIFCLNTKLYCHVASSSLWKELASIPNETPECWSILCGVAYGFAVHSLSHVRLFAAPGNAARQAPLSFTNSQSLLNSCPFGWWHYLTFHPLLPNFPFAFSLSQHQRLFQWVDSSYQVAKVLELQLQHQSFQQMFRVDLL